MRHLVATLKIECILSKSTAAPPSFDVDAKWRKLVRAPSQLTLVPGDALAIS